MSYAPIFFDTSDDKDTSRRNRPYLIFVEGFDDGHFLDVLLKDIGASEEAVGIISVGGKDRFKSNLTSFTKSHDFRNCKGIAFVQDGDAKPSEALSSLNRLLNPYAGADLSHASISEVSGRKWGIYILPDAEREGDLERVCLETVADTSDYLASHAYINEMLKTRQLTQNWKRQSQVFLAGFDKTLCRGTGYGFKAGAFDQQHDSLTVLKDWLRQFIGL